MNQLKIQLINLRKSAQVFPLSKCLSKYKILKDVLQYNSILVHHMKLLIKPSIITY